jgi:hypothetical protein
VPWGERLARGVAWEGTLAQVQCPLASGQGLPFCV